MQELWNLCGFPGAGLPDQDDSFVFDNLFQKSLLGRVDGKTARGSSNTLSRSDH